MRGCGNRFTTYERAESQRDRPQARRPPRAIRQPEAPGRARAGRQQAARELGAAGGAVGVDRGGGEAGRPGGRGEPDRRPRRARPRRARPGVGDPVRLRVPQSRPTSTSCRGRRPAATRTTPFPAPISCALEGDVRVRPARGAVSVFPPWGRPRQVAQHEEKSCPDSRNATAPAITAAGDGVSVGRRFTEAGVQPFDCRRVGDPRRPDRRSGEARRSSSAASSSRRAGRRTPPTSSPRSTSAGAWTRPSASTRSSR